MTSIVWKSKSLSSSPCWTVLAMEEVDLLTARKVRLQQRRNVAMLKGGKG